MTTSELNALRATIPKFPRIAVCFNVLGMNPIVELNDNVKNRERIKQWQKAFDNLIVSYYNR